MAEKKGDGDQYNVTSHGQQGGITAGRITIEAPQASVKADLVFANQKQEDGNYLTRTAVTLGNRHGASALVAEARGSHIVGIDATGDPPGVQFMVQSGVSEKHDAAVFRTGAPLDPRYNVDVHTSGPADLAIRVGLDVG